MIKHGLLLAVNTLQHSKGKKEEQTMSKTMTYLPVVL